ncbi:MAG TPA: VanZ family protein [Anaerolineae bacterium]
MKVGRLGSWMAVLGWMGFIFFLSAQPSFPDLGLSDRVQEALRVVAHFTLYVVLSLLTSRAVTDDSQRAFARFLIVIAICAVYALSDEWHQSFVPNRKADVFDWAVDMIGALVGYTLYSRRMKDEG